ncbi:MAG: Hsp20/alpha crystallin family protein [Gammaproteobacteria bacterium]|nr:Hsp20/alpha crystallin family protein [Gammaproteobacteria bacterium]
MQTKKDLSNSSNNDQHNYLAAFTNLEHKLENMFSHMWHNPFHRKDESEFSFPVSFNDIPKMDVIDRDKDIFIKAELPGIDKKDIDVSITNNRLLIKANTHHEYKEEKGDYLKQEIRTSGIYRSVELPGEVDDNEIKTSFKNGVLELTIPKHEISHRRRIKVE